MFKRMRAKVHRRSFLGWKSTFDRLDANFTEEEMLKDLLSFGPLDQSTATRMDEASV